MIQNYTGVHPLLAENHLSPVHCDVILATHKITYEKGRHNVYWRELVLGENWLHASIVTLAVSSIGPLMQICLFVHNDTGKKN